MAAKDSPSPVGGANADARNFETIQRRAPAASQPKSRPKAIAAPPASLRVPTAEVSSVRVVRAHKEAPPRPERVTLNAEDSAAQRDRLVADLDRLQSPDEAADWVHRNLSVKNTLTIADADCVEARFRDQLATIEALCQPADEPSGSVLEKPEPAGTGEAQSIAESIEWPAPTAPVIVPERVRTRRRSVAPKTIRLRDKLHCKYVAMQPCVVCGRIPSEAHHIRFAQPRALGRKVSDEYTVPVCRLHHRELHRYGDEASWWVGVNVDPLPIALELWKRSR